MPLSARSELNDVVLYIVDGLYMADRDHVRSTAYPPNPDFMGTCVACHSAGSFARRNLSRQHVKDTVIQGRPPRMPSFANRFPAKELEFLAEYVVRLSRLDLP